MKNTFYEISSSYLKIGLRTEENFDATMKKIKKNRKEYTLFYLSTLTDNMEIMAITQSIVENPTYNIQELILNGAVSETQDLKSMMKLALSGVAILLIKGKDYALAIESRSYHGRSLTEPDSEKTIRGSKDGFNESINDNISLIRRRIRSSDFKIELYSIGKKSKTDVAMVYLNNVADEKIIREIKSKLKRIDVESLVMTDRALEEELFGQKFNPFPLARYTQRPDIASINLLKGKIILIVDTSPSVIIVPISLFDHLKSVEEYRQPPLVGSFIKFIRTLAILVSIFLIPLWYVLVTESNISNFFIIQPTNSESLIPIFMQIIMAEFFVETIGLAVIYTPNVLTSTIGIVAAIIMGSVSIDLNLFLPEVLLYVAVSAISSYSTPSYELSLANRLVKYSLLILSILFGSSGLLLGVLILFCYLARIHVLDKYYLSPIIPFNGKDFIKLIFRKTKEDKKIL